jgi:hypothetical protein
VGLCMCRNMVFFAVVLVLLAGLQGANAEQTTAALNMRNCDPDGDGYYPDPSPSNCPDIITVIPDGGTVDIICSTLGSDVNGDSEWLYVTDGDYGPGFVADFYVNCGGPCQYPQCPEPL